ncbi:bacterial regulatory helix-turn-helix, lysR family protein [Burkholderia pseudomallei]|nr:bacterial regulatory helix-turn-helix, lysR family protein [Burkholderia pseudomallei]
MDRIDLFRVFARVVECANFTRAADTLGMPRSSVSAAIRELEGRVGARLLHRTTRKVTPTQDGAALYERCLRLIADVEETENLFRHSIVGPSGTLRVDMPGRIGRLIVAPALPEFLERYPQISVELGVTDRAVNLIEERVDCVLRVGTLSDSGLVARARSAICRSSTSRAPRISRATVCRARPPISSATGPSITRRRRTGASRLGNGSRATK